MANPAGSFFNVLQGNGQQSQVPGSRFEGDAEITLVGVTYTTGGILISTLCAGLPFTAVTHFMPSCIGPTPDSTVSQFALDLANKKLKLFNGSDTEVSNAQALDAYKLYAHVAGIR